MKCEELEAIVFSGKTPTPEQKEQMRAHSENCEACRALLENADLLSGVRSIDEEIEVPESFSQGWRKAIREQDKKVLRFEEQKKKRRPMLARVLSYAACAAVVLAAGVGLGRLSRENVASLETADYSNYAVYDAEMPTVGMRSMAANGANVQQDKKIVRRAWLNIRTSDFDNAVNTLRDRVTQMGGSVDNCEIDRAKDSSRSASLTLRVPSEQLDELLSSADELGEMMSEQTTSVDMTDTYTDNASRLESARAKKQQLDALYAKAENMEDIIALTNALFDVQEEIDSLEGQNRQIDHDVSYATLQVSISEKSSAVSAKQPFLTRMGEQFSDGLEHFGEFVSDSVLALTYALPWLAVLAVIFIVVALIVRKKLNKK